MTDDELRELLALAALNALDPDEQRSVDTAIAGRPDLQSELDELRNAAAQLAESEAATPPAGLKASILAEIAVTRQSATGGATEPPRSRAKAVSMRRSWIAGVAAAVAVVALIGVAVWSASDSSPEVAEQIEAVLELPDVEALELHGDVDGVRILHSPSSTAAVLVDDGMPDPGDDRAYQLWFSRDGIVTPANVFRPDSDGHVEVLLEDFQPVGAVITVTLEPAGGSDQPTGPPIVSSD